MLLLLPLVDKRKNSSQQAKDQINLSANIADMCIPSQIICDSDPKVLDVFDIVEDRSLQSIWSTDLSDPFSCYLHHIAFERLKSHTPFPCPAYQLIYIFLKFQCILCIINFSIANTVIRKESYFRINVWEYQLQPALRALEVETGVLPLDLRRG